MSKLKINMLKYILLAFLLLIISKNGSNLLFYEDIPALIEDEEIYENTDIPIALGPKPRLVSPAVQNIFYRGDEWIFYLYRNYCREWRKKNGYAPPRWHSDRKHNYNNPH